MGTLITFDVDGTLIEAVGKGANQLHKDSFGYAFQSVFNVNTHIDVVEHHGHTDPLVLVKVLTEAHGLEKESVLKKLPLLEERMIEFYLKHQSRAGDGLHLLPGVQKLLEKLKAMPNVYTALVTGNLEPIAWGKMQALGVSDLFTQPRFGGFGSDFCSGNLDEPWRDRAELIRTARRKAPEEVSKRIHVGDTPFDVLSAKDAGFLPVGVPTGKYEAKALLEAVPETVLIPSFQEVDRALRTLGLM